MILLHLRPARADMAFPPPPQGPERGAVGEDLPSLSPPSSTSSPWKPAAAGGLLGLLLLVVLLRTRSGRAPR